MTTFNTDEFLAHFFKEGETVEVNAAKLQAFIRDTYNEDVKNKNTISKLRTHIALLESKVEALQMERCSSYRLDLSA